jgi:hypothetical protein
MMKGIIPIAGVLVMFLAAVAAGVILSGKAGAITGTNIGDVIINNTAATTLKAGYPVRITIDTATPIAAGSMASDCSNVHFWFLNGNDYDLDRQVQGCNALDTNFTIAVQADVAAGVKDGRYNWSYGINASDLPRMNLSNVFPAVTPATLVEYLFQNESAYGAGAIELNQNRTGGDAVWNATYTPAFNKTSALWGNSSATTSATGSWFDIPNQGAQTAWTFEMLVLVGKPAAGKTPALWDIRQGGNDSMVWIANDVTGAVRWMAEPGCDVTGGSLAPFYEQWVYIKWTGDADNCYGYINGTLVATDTDGSSLATATQPFRIGGGTWNNNAANFGRFNINWFRMRNELDNTASALWTYPLPDAVAGPAGGTDTISITINAPASGATYMNDTVYYSASTGGTLSSYDCYRRIDNVTETSIGNVANGTTISGSYAVTHGTGKSLNITCVNETTIGKDVNSYSIIKYNFTGQSGQSAAYETNYTQFYHTINTTSDVSNINASLMYNGTATASAVTKQGNNYFIYSNVSIPLLSANNTAMPWNLNYTLQWSNGTYQTLTNNTIGQDVYFAYNIASFQAPTETLEGETFTVNSTTATALSYATLSNYITYYGINHNAAYNAGTWSVTLTAPTAYTISNASTLYSSMLISFGGRSRTSQVNQTVTNYRLYIGPCGGISNTTWMTLYAFDERDLTEKNFSMGATFVAHSGSISYNYSIDNTSAAALNYTICMAPSTKTFAVDGTIDYSSLPQYEQRHYFLDNAMVSNTTGSLNLYMLNTTFATLTQFTVQDNNGVVQPDVIIQLQRWYTGTNTYRTVVMGKTDASGNAVIRIEQINAWYLIVFESGGTILQTFPSQEITSSTNTLKLNPQSHAEFWNYYGKVASQCNQNVSNWLTCMVTDTSGVMQSARLVLQRYGATDWTTVCDLTATGAGVTLPCFMDTNITGKAYYYTLTMNTNSGNRQLLDNGYIGAQNNALQLGKMGVLMAALLIFALVAVGSYNPAVALTFAVIGLIVTFILGLVTMSAGALIAMIIILAIMIKGMKS